MANCSGRIQILLHFWFYPDVHLVVPLGPAKGRPTDAVLGGLTMRSWYPCTSQGLLPIAKQPKIQTKPNIAMIGLFVFMVLAELNGMYCTHDLSKVFLPMSVARHGARQGLGKRLARCEDMMVQETLDEQGSKHISRPGVKVPLRVLLHGICDDGAIFHERAEDLGVAQTSEKHKRSTFVFGLDARGRDYTVNVGLEDTSTEDRERIPYVADSMARKRL
ncbi:hypothetical protein HD554DRAFT_2043146 [Boletus coccyginus]|nr:hypothetical protein HD554DRAFT_2043146 [Boletus coccyginus]